MFISVYQWSRQKRLLELIIGPGRMNIPPSTMKYRWTMAPAQEALSRHLSGQTGISPLLAQCLLNRGLSETEPVGRFLNPRLQDLSDPFLLPDMDRAVERLVRARKAGEPITLFGDYDVDGVSATALLSDVLTTLGWSVQTYLPRRFEDGYGLTEAGLAQCLKQYETGLILAVDCGSTSVEAIRGLAQRGIEVVVLDHHQVSDPAPEAVALVNPQRARPGPSAATELCSAGLAFKLVHALVKHGRQEGWEREKDFDIRPYLDLVALGTIADLVPLTGENRILVSAGIRCLNQTRRPGIRALLEVAKITGELGPYELGFQLGPRLNAAGRLDDATAAFQLLVTQDSVEASALAGKLDACNRKRQTIERTIVEEATRFLEERFDADSDYIIVEGQNHWHIGVVGIVASRLMQSYYRPTFVLGGDGDLWRGSGRSIDGFDLARALHECSDLLVRHGGHAKAAGISVQPDKVDAFRDRLNKVARQSLSQEALKPSLKLDAAVGLDTLTLKGLMDLQRLQPTGMGNPAIRLMARDLQHQRPLQRMGAEKQHVKMWVADGTAVQECVWWNAGHGELPVGQFDLAFSPKLNEFRGRTTVQLSVLDWRNTTDPS